MFACVPTHKSAEANSLAVRVDFADRDELIANAPDTFYVKEHYLSYPCVLVRLDEIHADGLHDLLLMGWRYMSRKKKRRAR